MLGEPSSRLDGWKAIADHLGRNVRTAQRWRDERGMPVHRVPGRKGGAIFANAVELDAWLFQTTIASTPAAHPDFSPTIAAPLLVPQTAVPTRTSNRVRWLTAIALGLIGAGIAVLYVRLAESSSAEAPARVEMSGNALVARDASGAALWSYPLPHQSGASADDAVVTGTQISTFAQVNLDAIGSAGIIAFLNRSKAAESPQGPSFAGSELLYLSSRGNLRWRYSPAGEKLTFNGREFAGPWRFRTWLVAPGVKPRLWASFIDHVWWPSFVVRVGADGRTETAFVNAGHIESLERVQLAGGTHILAGGVNNEFRSAALAVLDEAGAPATSPQTAGSSYQCDRCPTARPRKYFIFPRSEVNVALGEPLNFADTITAQKTASASVEISVRESSTLGLQTVYRLSENLTAESVAISDRYWEAHRELSQKGKLDHAPEQCPDGSRGVRIKMWTPDAGWTEVVVPPTFAPSPLR